MTGWEPVLALPVTPGRDHVRGPEGAAVSLVEYGDFECPFCAAARPTVEAAITSMDDDLQFAFRHFPLVTVHSHAEYAAEAAEAAGAQGHFWTMHDLLLARQDRLAIPDLIARAQAIGLDVDRFEAELVGRVHVRRVQEDLLSGVHSGVAGTPTFFINGARYDGQVDVDLVAAVEMAAARS